MAYAEIALYSCFNLSASVKCYFTARYELRLSITTAVPVLLQEFEAYKSISETVSGPSTAGLITVVKSIL